MQPKRVISRHAARIDFGEPRVTICDDMTACLVVLARKMWPVAVARRVLLGDVEALGTDGGLFNVP